MDIVTTVNQVLKQGLLSPEREALLERICASNRALEVEEYEALTRLQRAIADGRVVAPERKHCLNVMEELVWEVVVESFAELRNTHENLPDMGDVAAYALNRLKPLYATTEEGAEYQRTHAATDLNDEIRARVGEAMEHSLATPVPYPDRTNLVPPSGRDARSRIVTELQMGVPSME